MRQVLFCVIPSELQSHRGGGLNAVQSAAILNVLLMFFSTIQPFRWPPSMAERYERALARMVEH